MGGDDSGGDVSPPMAADHEEPQANTERPLTTEQRLHADNIMDQILSLGLQLSRLPPCPSAAPDTTYFVWSVGSEGDDFPSHGDGDGGEDDYAYGFGAVPAAAEAMAALPATAVGESDGAREGECSVCLEGYAAGDTLRTMPCEHGFHEGCIFGWLAVGRLCPLCRFALPAEAETDSEDEADDDDDDMVESSRSVFCVDDG